MMNVSNPTNSSLATYLDRPEWGEEIVRNQNRSVMQPLEINEPLAWILGIICLFVFPLNFEIIAKILYNKTMRLKSRYIVQLAVACSGLSILFDIALIVLHYFYGPNETVCHFFIAILMGISYNCFLLNYFLSLIDCFVAITLPLWRLVNVTAAVLFTVSSVSTRPWPWPWNCRKSAE